MSVGGFTLYPIHYRAAFASSLIPSPLSHWLSLQVDVHTPKANVQCTTLDRKPLKSVRNRHQTNTILNTLHEPKSTTVLELKYRSYEMFTIIQEFTEKYRDFEAAYSVYIRFRGVNGTLQEAYPHGETTGLLRSPSRSTRGKVVPLGRWCTIRDGEIRSPLISDN